MTTILSNQCRNQLILILIFSMIFALLSCKKDAEGFIIYTIKAGNHKCIHKIVRTWNDKSMDFEFTTNNTWIWEDQHPKELHGWSKIIGFSEGFHNENSLRLGYRYNSPYMIIGLYARVNGNIRGVYLDTIQINRTYFCRLAREGDFYVVRINGKEAKCEAGNMKRWGYVCFPYIGGDYVIKHDWKVKIKQK